VSEERKVDMYAFPECMHAFNAALHREGIDPACCVIEMPFDQWWRLSQVLQSKFKHLFWFDGHQRQLDSFTYIGFKFVHKETRK
jgi:hypothetical protein